MPHAAQCVAADSPMVDELVLADILFLKRRPKWFVIYQKGILLPGFLKNYM
jgi:hypothetical protein